VEDLSRLIAQHPVFAGLGEADLAFVAGCATNVRVDAGTYLFREGDDAGTFYLLRQGIASVEVHEPGRAHPRRVQTLGDGDAVGWSWIIPPYRHRFDVRAVDDLRALAFDGECLRGKCEEDPRLGYSLMQRFAGIAVERLQATLAQLIDLYGQGVTSGR
jgi:CRP/FNR family transcriptional regulator, cyclic AMP receptor protein